MSEKFYVEIDASPWLTAEGVTTSVFLGEGACEPCYENTQTFEDLINKELEAHTVRGLLRNITHPGKDHDNIGEALKFVEALEEAAMYARKRFEDLRDE